MEATCKRPSPNSIAHVLGIDIDDAPDEDAQLDEANGTVSELHHALHELRDPGVELVLLRNCADACKVVHLLRAKGSDIARSSCEKGLESIMCGRLHEEAYLQATLSVSESGLGLRRTSDLALPASIASRVQAKAAVHALLAQDVDGIFPQNLSETFDEKLNFDISVLLSELSPAGVARTKNLIEEDHAKHEE